jgi:predicted SAM-dependent methyltransferase
VNNVVAAPLRLHIGCGTKPMPGWVNIDPVARAPGVSTDIDPTALPYPANSVDEVLAEHVFEHFCFAEEAKVWHEMARVLRRGGRLVIEDFEWVCESFLAAKDDWREFYIVGHADHYGGCGRMLDQRWGILQTMFFGNQNGAGQYHRSAYTQGKLHSIARLLDFRSISVKTVFNKGGQALRATLTR